MILLNEHIYDFDLDVALRIIPEQRRDYALKYQREIDRRLSVKAYLLLCEGLRELYGIQEMPLFSYTTSGKPILTHYPEIHFNLSHCNEAVLCTIDTQPIGVDIESIKAYDKELAQYTMNSKEMATIENSSRPEVEFTRFWTMKEAVLKRNGEGISNNIKEILTKCTEDITTTIDPNQKYVYSICR